MKNVESHKVWYIALLVIGIALYVTAGFMALMDDFWGGLGLGFIIISALRLVQIVRYQKDDDYAKKVTIAYNDERNQFLANKARSTAFYISILLEAIVSLVFQNISCFIFCQKIAYLKRFTIINCYKIINIDFLYTNVYNYKCDRKSISH